MGYSPRSGQERSLGLAPLWTVRPDPGVTSVTKSFFQHHPVRVVVRWKIHLRVVRGVYKPPFGWCWLLLVVRMLLIVLTVRPVAPYLVACDRSVRMDEWMGAHNLLSNVQTPAPRRILRGLGLATEPSCGPDRKSTATSRPASATLQTQRTRNVGLQPSSF